MKKILTISSLLFLLSCGGNKSLNFKAEMEKNYPELTTAVKIPPQTSIDSLLKLIYKNELTRDGSFQASVKDRQIYKNNNHVLNSLRVVEDVDIPGKNLKSVFYEYSVGSAIFREHGYFKKLDGYWFLYNHYYSSYDDDPFGNGKGVEGKAHLEKISKWEESNRKNFEDL